MIKKIFSGAGTSQNMATLEALEAFNTYFTAFDNVELVEKFNISGNAYRYIYLVNGFENIYFCLENSTTASSNLVYLSFRIAANIHATANAGNSLYTTQFGAVYGSGIGFDSYILAKNNNVYGITVTQYGIPIPLNIFVNQSGEKYIIRAMGSTGEAISAYADDATGSRYYINNMANYAYAESEKALLKNAIVTLANTQSSNYVLKVSELFFVISSQLQTFTLALIDIEGVKYRQVGAQYLFALDGDSE